jgi:hypothetical protein
MKRVALLSGIALFAASTAMASDMPVKGKNKKVVAPAPVAAAAPAAPAAPALTDTIGIEFSPEFYASNSTSGKADGGVVDAYAKLSYSHTFDGAWVVGGAYQFTQRAAVDYDSSVSQFEVNGGYKLKMDALTITPGLGLGYAIGTPKIATDANASEAYYFATLNFDYKIDSKWTVNALQLRYRQSFDGYWFTPKVGTGVTYAITPADAIYVALGYAWKDSTDHNGTVMNGNNADKQNIAIGYKHSF